MIRVLALAVLALAGAALHAAAAPFAYVSNFSSASVSVIDVATGTVTATVPAGCTNVYGVAVNSAGTRAYFNCRSDGSVRVIDTSTNTVIATIPAGCAVAGDLAIDTANSRVYTACGGPDTVVVIDATSNTVLTSVPVGLDPVGVAIHPASSRLYVTLTNTANAVAVIDTSTNIVVATVPVGNNPIYVAVNPAGTRAYVSNSNSRDISVIDTATNTVIATYATTQPPPPPASQSHDILGIAVSPDGARLYVSHRLTLSQIVDVLDAASGAILTTIPVAPGPRGLAFSPDGTRLLVVNQSVNSVQAIDVATNTVVATAAVGSQPINVAMAPSTPSNVTINQAASQADPTNAATINFTVVFDENVTGFTGADVSFAGSTAPGTLVANVTGGPATYNVAVSGMTGPGTVVASIPAGAAADGVGSPSLASTSTDNTVTFDNVAPTVTINQSGGQADPTAVSPIVFSVVFSEPVTGFTGADVSFAGSTAPGALVANVTGTGASYTVSVSGMTGNGIVVASIPAAAANDLAGNASLASTSTDNSVVYTGASTVVTTFTGPSATGSGNITASFTGGGATCSYSGPQFVGSPPGAAPIPPTAPPGSIGFPHGLFSFTTVNCTPGATLTFTVTYPGGLPAGTQYWKYGPEPGNTTPHWYVLPAAIAGNVATFSITDGAQGDDDLAANGRIVDQGGPGFPVVADTRPVPTLSEWAMALLALMMMFVTVGVLRRRPGASAHRAR